MKKPEKPQGPPPLEVRGEPGKGLCVLGAQGLLPR